MCCLCYDVVVGILLMKFVIDVRWFDVLMVLKFEFFMIVVLLGDMSVYENCRCWLNVLMLVVWWKWYVGKCCCMVVIIVLMFVWLLLVISGL